MQSLDIGTEELKLEQKADETLKKYREFAEQPDEYVRTYFFVKKGILYRKYYGGQDEDGVVQLVVPKGLRQKVVALAHDTLLSEHRGAALNRVQQEFYWPGMLGCVKVCGIV